MKTTPVQNSMSSDGTAEVLDALIPGDGARWPAFSAAVAIDPFKAGLAPDARLGLAKIGAATLGLPDKDRIEAIAGWEKSDPAAFGVILKAAHRAYYTAPSVASAVQTLANAGPREASLQFDVDLVQQVIASDVGRRRL